MRLWNHGSMVLFPLKSVEPTGELYAVSRYGSAFWASLAVDVQRLIQAHPKSLPAYRLEFQISLLV